MAAPPPPRTSLLEQKRIQWAKEREEMSRLTGGPRKTGSTLRSSVRTFGGSLCEMNAGQHRPRYTSSVSLVSLSSNLSGRCTSGLRELDYASTSLTNLRDQAELERIARQRSPSLPPIYTSNEYRYQDCCRQSSSTHRCSHTNRRQRSRRTAAGSRAEEREEREGETSGYASDNLEGQQQVVALPAHVNGYTPDLVMGEKTWLNPYYTDDSSLPPPSKLGSLKAGEFNRQRWGSVWGQEISKDPPPPSWMERGLSRLDTSSQVLVINHDSTSSPDSSTTGSFGSDTSKTYLRGQNMPVDSDILQEREVRRQKALENQNAIKQQLEERERKKKEERERKLKEERAEEERIQKERDLEKQRLEEEYRRQREKEAAKLKKSKAMQESIEAAERQAKAEKRQRRRKDGDTDEQLCEAPSNNIENGANIHTQSQILQNTDKSIDKELKQEFNRRECNAPMDPHHDSPEVPEPVRLPISQEVAIVLSGRIEDPDLLSKSSLKLVNLVVSPSPMGSRGRDTDIGGGISLSAILNGLGSPVILHTASRASSGLNETRLLTPSKYRVPSGRDCGTQTDCEGELSSDLMGSSQEIKLRDAKDRKEAANNCRKDIDKSTNTDLPEEMMTKSVGRIKSQVHTSIEARPRWNANRPGTRYRTQSEKDPHYQRRMRLRHRQPETSDEGSSDFRRSPSPNRRKYGITKAKSRNFGRRKTKQDNYDADLSMDSLNSLVPLLTDKDGRISIERRNETLIRGQNNAKDVWGGDVILTHLTSLRNGLMMKKKEWDLQACPVSPITELY